MAFIIYYPGVHAEVFLAQTDTEEQAWKLFLEQETGYQEQQDGTFQHQTIIHDDLQAALNMYGLTGYPDGSYSNADGLFASLDEAKATYGIKEGRDTVTSHDKSYSNLIAALHAVLSEAHYLEIAPVMIDQKAIFQSLFVSKDKWDYVESSPAEDVKKDILSEHRWQAERYERLNLLPNAIAELRQGLRISTSAGDKVYFHNYLARLLVKTGKLFSAARHYENALNLNMNSGEPSLIHYRAAEIYLRLGRQRKALQHYQKIDLEDLRDEEIADVKEQLEKLQQ